MVESRSRNYRIRVGDSWYSPSEQVNQRNDNWDAWKPSIDTWRRHCFEKMDRPIRFHPSRHGRVGNASAVQWPFSRVLQNRCQFCDRIIILLAWSQTLTRSNFGGGVELAASSGDPNSHLCFVSIAGARSDKAPGA